MRLFHFLFFTLVHVGLFSQSACLDRVISTVNRTHVFNIDETMEYLCMCNPKRFGDEGIHLVFNDDMNAVQFVVNIFFDGRGLINFYVDGILDGEMRRGLEKRLDSLFSAKRGYPLYSHMHSTEIFMWDVPNGYLELQRRGRGWILKYAK